MTDRAETLVACVVLIDEQGRCLLNSRPEGKVYAGWWEFPGGKLEAMETVEEAARREMKEELGIVVPNTSPWVTLVYDYPHARVRLHFVRAWQWLGQPRAMEKQTFGFFSAQECPSPLLEASEPIFKWLQMPKHWLMVKNADDALVETTLKERHFDGVILCGNHSEKLTQWRRKAQDLGIEEIWVDAGASRALQQNADGVFVDEGQTFETVSHKRFAVKADNDKWDWIAQSGALFAWVDPSIRVASSAWLRLMSQNSVPLFLTNVKINDECLLRPHGAHGWIETI